MVISDPERFAGQTQLGRPDALNSYLGRLRQAADVVLRGGSDSMGPHDLVALMARLSAGLRPAEVGTTAVTGNGGGPQLIESLNEIFELHAAIIRAAENVVPEASAALLADSRRVREYVVGSAREAVRAARGDRYGDLQPGPSGPLAELPGTNGRCARPRLSAREREVIELVAAAMSNSQIARRLDITEGTVKRHLRNIFAKLGAVSRLDAVNKAVATRQLARPY